MEALAAVVAHRAVQELIRELPVKDSAEEPVLMGAARPVAVAVALEILDPKELPPRQDQVVVEFNRP
jgi:hypothetical protein